MLSEQLDKMTEIFDYIESKTNAGEALKLCRHLGFDDPHILKKMTLEECKRIVDKLLNMRKLMKGG